MPIITELIDSETDNVTLRKSTYPATAGSERAARPHIPSVAEMRESQRLGSVGNGTSSQDYGDMQGSNNMGTGKESAEKD